MTSCSFLIYGCTEYLPCFTICEPQRLKQEASVKLRLKDTKKSVNNILSGGFCDDFFLLIGYLHHNFIISLFITLLIRTFTFCLVCCMKTLRFYSIIGFIQIIGIFNVPKHSKTSQMSRCLLLF